MGWNCPVSSPATRRRSRRTYGKFVAEPFERGFGVTIGNGLRRILLSSLEGSSVTQIKIHGAQHEFTTLPGVVEDMTDIVLNIKSLVVKNHSDRPSVMRIEKNTKGVVTGADVQTDDSVEVINKHHVIATLTDDVPFVMEMVIENGRGYVPATEHSPNVQEIGIIPVDAVYSPVVRVRYEIEETRVGQKTNYDKLTHGDLDQRLDPSGDGAGRIGQDSPQAPQSVRAVQRVGLARARGRPRRQSSAATRRSSQKLNMSLAELKLSVRATNCLESENIHTVRDLVRRTEDQLLEVRNFGETTLNEVQEKLTELGLRLGMRVPASASV